MYVLKRGQLKISEWIFLGRDEHWIYFALKMPASSPPAEGEIPLKSTSICWLFANNVIRKNEKLLIVRLKLKLETNGHVCLSIFA